MYIYIYLYIYIYIYLYIYIFIYIYIYIYIYVTRMCSYAILMLLVCGFIMNQFIQVLIQ